MAGTEKATQIDRFRATARELECDEDKGRFEAAFDKIAKAKTKAKLEPKNKRPARKASRSGSNGCSPD